MSHDAGDTVSKGIFRGGAVTAALGRSTVWGTGEANIEEGALTASANDTQGRRWYEVLQDDSMSIPHAQRVIAQRETAGLESALLQQWCIDACSMLRLSSRQFAREDMGDMQGYKTQMAELELRQERSELELEVVAAIPQMSERLKRKRKRQRTRVLMDHTQLQQAADVSDAIHRAVLARLRLYRHELPMLFHDGPRLLSHLGSMTSATMSRSVGGTFKMQLAEWSQKERIDLSSTKASDSNSKFHRKLTLSALDRHPHIALSNGDLMATHTDKASTNPRWGITRATESLWPTPRYISPTLRAILDEARSKLGSQDPIELMLQMGHALSAVYPDSTDFDEEDLNERFEARGPGTLIRQGSSTVGSRRPSLGRTLSRTRSVLQRELSTANSTPDLSRKPSELGRSASSLIRTSSTASESADDSNGALGREAAARLLIEQAQNTAREFAISGVMCGATLPQAIDAHVTYTGVRFSRLDALQSRIAQLGLPIKLAHNAVDPSVLRQGCQHLLDVLEHHALTHGRYYFEVHPHSSAGWVIGFTTDQADLCAFPGENSDSFGIADDGSVWWAGQNEKFCKPLREVSIVGVCIDLHAGTVVIYRDGVHSGIAFGRNSTAFRSVIASQQARLLSLDRARQLVVCLAIRGLEHNRSRGDASGKQSKFLFRQASNMSVTSNANSNAAWRVRERPQPRLSLNFGSFPFVYAVPGVRSVDSYIVFAPDAGFSMFDSQPSARSIKNIVHLMEEIDPHTLFEAEPEAPTNAIGEAIGSDDFDVGLFAAMSARTKRRRQEAAQKKAVAKLKGHIISEEVGATLFGMDTSVLGAALQKGAQVLDNPEGGYFVTDQEMHVNNAFARFSAMRKDAGSRREPQPSSEALMNDTARSWSAFPPPTYQKNWAASTIQRCWRAYKEKKDRIMMMRVKQRACRVIQRCVRRWLHGRRERKLRAAIVIQKWVRRYLVRKVYKVASVLKLHPRKCLAATLILQRTFRRYILPKLQRRFFRRVKLCLQRMRHAVILWQSLWYAFYCRKPEAYDRIRNRAATKIQSVWRGFVDRFNLMTETPGVAYDLLDIGNFIQLWRDIKRNIWEVELAIRAAKLLTRRINAVRDLDFGNMGREPLVKPAEPIDVKKFLAGAGPSMQRSASVVLNPFLNNSNNNNNNNNSNNAVAPTVSRAPSSDPNSIFGFAAPSLSRAPSSSQDGKKSVRITSSFEFGSSSDSSFAPEISIEPSPPLTPRGGLGPRRPSGSEGTEGDAGVSSRRSSVMLRRQNSDSIVPPANSNPFAAAFAGLKRTATTSSMEMKSQAAVPTEAAPPTLSIPAQSTDTSPAPSPSAGSSNPFAATAAAPRARNVLFASDTAPDADENAPVPPSPSDDATKKKKLRRRISFAIEVPDESSAEEVKVEKENSGWNEEEQTRAPRPPEEASTDVAVFEGRRKRVTVALPPVDQDDENM